MGLGVTAATCVPALEGLARIVGLTGENASPVPAKTVRRPGRAKWTSGSWEELPSWLNFLQDSQF